MALIPNIIIAPHCIPFWQNGRDRQAVVVGGVQGEEEEV